MVSLLLCLLSACVTPANKEGDVITNIQKSTVRVEMAEGKCSGWVLKGSHNVITAAHCQEDKMTVFMADGKEYPAHPTKVGDSSGDPGKPDIMVLAVDAPTSAWPEGLAICPFPAYYGENLTLFGQPLGVSESMSWGKVAKPSHKFNEDGGSYIEYDGRQLPGNSGGAAVDVGENCVMGMSELTFLARPGSDTPYGMQFLTPAARLDELH